ncbi:zinc-binding dehydrogenase [Streptomyces sp. RB110-2]|uniref:zinc-binding dehydrogenase n=1 Tax=Streptomyces sp. RB110-2 TaxID=2794863 RepID=UPI0027DA2766|nr:zinc-binding dehydrogenase [Streptomyces sp. RB110-2]
MATASTQAKLDFARELGADVTVNYTDEDWTDQVLAATDGRGADIVLETVGGDVLLKSLGITAPVRDARLLRFGLRRHPGPAHPRAVPHEERRGLQPLRHALQQAGRRGRGAAPPARLIASGEVKPVVHDRLPLDEAVKAHELLEARAQLGKIVLVP